MKAEIKWETDYFGNVVFLFKPLLSARLAFIQKNAQGLMPDIYRVETLANPMTNSVTNSMTNSMAIQFF